MHCVRIDKDGLVYVCDRTNDRVQIFRKDGTFVSEHFYEKNTRATGSVYELVFSPDKEQKFIYMIDGANGEVRIVDHATRRCWDGSAGSAARPASSRRSTTSRSITRATSTRPRWRPASASSGSAGSTRRIDRNGPLEGCLDPRTSGR